jgi:hypothetical protein
MKNYGYKAYAKTPREILAHALYEILVLNIRET